MPPRNARFWDYQRGGWVKLTLRPGQTLQRFTGGADSEGWWTCREWWAHTGDGVRYTVFEEARDCDGKLERGGEYWCALAEIGAVLADPESAAPDAPPRPNWTVEDTSQRDYAAEAAGY